MIIPEVFSFTLNAMLLLEYYLKHHFLCLLDKGFVGFLLCLAGTDDTYPLY